MSPGRLLSWGNHPPFAQIPRVCHWREELASELASARRAHGTTLAFGNGRSYGDSCFAASDHVLHVRRLNHFISADWLTGVITAETGVTFEEILAVAIPRGWFLPVTPGTKHVTLGGAIANDVHGKNHHQRGTLGRFVHRLGLVRTDTGRMICSPESNSELFAATIGGLGLTGLIEWAEIQLVPIQSSDMACLTQRFDNLDDFFALSAELDASHEFCVSWIDCSARGHKVGRGVYTAGNHTRKGALTVESPRKFAMPFTPPVSLVNRASLLVFNELLWRKSPRARTLHRMGYEPFFYPLDSISHWNRIYGSKGFQQYQCVIPEAEARPALRALLAEVARSGTGSFLAVIKRCGDVPSPGLLSFPMPGATLALDFPQRNDLGTQLFPRLDAIVREAGGRLYPAKDAHMSGEDFRRSYPSWPRVEALRDPALLSRLWQRVIG